MLYSKYVNQNQEQYKIDGFCASIEAMKQVSRNYLEMERGYAKDWSKYIEAKDLTLNEALEYINEANNQEDRYAHIVDMDTYEAYSTHIHSAGNTISCYKNFNEVDNTTNRIFIANMKKMFTSDKDEMNVLGKYRINESQINVISVGTRVRLRLEGNRHKEYLLLRIIPVEAMKKNWVFPVALDGAQVGVITKSGSYVVPSNAMKSVSFLEFIRGYNFADDYNKVNELEHRLATTDKGLMEYKDSKGEDCYWYYSRFGDNSNLYILGYMPAKSFEGNDSNWYVNFIISIIFAILIIVDVRYALRINKKLKEAVKTADYASKAKTKFISSMSHDIRTPMNAIIGITNLAKHHTDNPKYVKNCLDKISRASNHLLTLINDILDISKVETGNMMLNPTTFSVKELVENILEIVCPQINDKKINFNVKIDDFKYKYLFADELRLNQIFINLLSNAIKYTNSGGEIKLEIKEELSKEYENRVQLIFKLADNGIGMTEEFQKNMYDSFSREKDSRIDKIQGSGLGLAIVKQLVDLMNGSIQCESKLGEGTSFTVTVELEIATVFQEAQAREYKESKNGSTYSDGSESGLPENSREFEGMRVLIAEDNDINWEIIRELLREYGVKADRAENGEECVKMITEAKEGAYELIFMDVQMPVMNGKEATKFIRNSDKEYVRDIMIVAMTADAFAEDVQECMAVGMNGHIAKPIDMRIVLEFLRKAKNK